MLSVIITVKCDQFILQSHFTISCFIKAKFFVTHRRRNIYKRSTESKAHQSFFLRLIHLMFTVFSINFMIIFSKVMLQSRKTLQSRFKIIKFVLICVLSFRQSQAWLKKQYTISQTSFYCVSAVRCLENYLMTQKDEEIDVLKFLMQLFFKFHHHTESTLSCWRKYWNLHSNYRIDHCCLAHSEFSFYWSNVFFFLVDIS